MKEYFPALLLAIPVWLLFIFDAHRSTYGMKNPRIEKIPAASEKSIGIGMEVEPRNANMDRWVWRTFFTFNGNRSLTSYLGDAGWQRPSPYEVIGEASDEGTAWERARECADEARARWAAEQVRIGRKSSDHVPL